MDLSTEEGEEERSLQEQCVGQLLRVARTKISEGGGGAEDALAALLHAVRITQGEDAIMDVLEGAKRRADEEAAASQRNDAHEVALRMSRLAAATSNSGRRPRQMSTSTPSARMWSISVWDGSLPARVAAEGRLPSRSQLLPAAFARPRAT